MVRVRVGIMGKRSQEVEVDKPFPKIGYQDIVSATGETDIMGWALILVEEVQRMDEEAERLHRRVRVESSKGVRKNKVAYEAALLALKEYQDACQHTWSHRRMGGTQQPEFWVRDCHKCGGHEQTKDEATALGWRNEPSPMFKDFARKVASGDFYDNWLPDPDEKEEDMTKETMMGKLQVLVDLMDRSFDKLTFGERAVLYQRIESTEAAIMNYGGGVSEV